MRCGHRLSASLGISRSSGVSPLDMTSSPPASSDSSCSDASASRQGLSTGPRRPNERLFDDTPDMPGPRVKRPGAGSGRYPQLAYVAGNKVVDTGFHRHDGGSGPCAMPRLIFPDALTIFLNPEHNPARSCNHTGTKTHDAAALCNRAPHPRSGDNRLDARRHFRRPAGHPERTPAQQQTHRDASVALIVALRPRDPVEAAYATRAAAAHYGAMECFRRAMLPDVPDSVAIRWHRKAVALSRMNAEMIRTLEQCQAETPRVQPQPAAQAAMPAVSPASALAEAARCAASIPAKPVGTQACPRAPEPRDPTSNERPSLASSRHAPSPRCHVE
jgi:hypothetical protein